MTGIRPTTLLQSLTAIAAATLLAACADAPPVGPDARSAGSSRDLLAAEADGRLPELGICDNLAAPEGSHVSFKVFGKGVQIYSWNGTAWVFVGPEAKLYADAGGHGLVGTHFGGPTGPNWLTNSGSRVVGTVAENGRCTPNPDAIPWLKLDAVASGQGVFENTTLIQRLNTVGGKAPSAPGSVIGQEARVPYTSDYIFYRVP
jgi:hypothetical protein